MISFDAKVKYNDNRPMTDKSGKKKRVSSVDSAKFGKPRVVSYSKSREICQKRKMSSERCGLPIHTSKTRN